MKEYEIWVGYYHLGQGDHGSREPQLLAKVKAVNFKTACYKYELESSLKRIVEGELRGNLNNQDYEWWYNPRSNSNSWTGKYYTSKEEALKTFK